jgi:hypothetical protein
MVSSDSNKPYPKLSTEETERVLREAAAHLRAEREFRARLRVSELRTIPELTPKHDARFAELMDAALKGQVPIYFAAVPLGLCVPFDLDYRPDQHPVGAEAIRQHSKQGEGGNLQHIIVYQRGSWFVVADDYISLFASLSGMPDYVPCWIMGKPDSALVKDVQGPLAVSDVRGIFGLM